MERMKVYTRVFSGFARLWSMRFHHNLRNVSLKYTDSSFVGKSSKLGGRWSRFYWTAPLLPVASLAFAPVVHAWGSSKDGKGASVTSEASKDEALVAKADELYSRNAIPELYAHLVQHKDSSNDELLWRLCRAACDKAKMTQNKEEKKALMYEAYAYVQRALELNDKNFASHKWLAIMLDYVGEYEGTKQRISNAYKVKEHFMKAIELNPTDATSVHLLGYWCFVFAELPWYQKKVAAVIFATPPSSTYEEALKYFLDAENLSPNFYSRNLLYLGKSYLRLNNKQMATLYLTRTRDCPVVTEDDKEAHKESVDLLKSLGVKDAEQ